MTNLEAIKGAINHPLSENSYKRALINRGLTDSDTYVVGNKQSLDLASADCIVTLLTTGSISEGGYSISLADAATLKSLAIGIYSKYGIANPFLKNTATFVQRW